MVNAILLSLALVLCLGSIKCNRTLPTDCISPHEHYEDHSIGCEKLCSMPYFPGFYSCAHAPMPECICDKGYYRIDGGGCVPFNECPLLHHGEYTSAHTRSLPLAPLPCSVREYFEPACKGCVPSCDLPIIPRIRSCWHPAFPKCLCKKGYLRTKGHECVLPTECPPKACRLNEHFVNSSVGCEKSCDYPVYTFPCAHAPIAMCVCDERFYRTPTGKCVTLDKCSPPLNLDSSCKAIV